MARFHGCSEPLSCVYLALQTQLNSRLGLGVFLGATTALACLFATGCTLICREWSRGTGLRFSHLVPKLHLGTRTRSSVARLHGCSEPLSCVYLALQTQLNSRLGLGVFLGATTALACLFATGCTLICREWSRGTGLRFSHLVPKLHLGARA